MKSAHSKAVHAEVPARDFTDRAPSLVPALTRAIRILELLEAAPRIALSLHEIAGTLGIPKSTAHNLCTTMVEEKLLRRSEGGYRLGRRLVQLGSSYVSSVDLIREFYDCCLTIPDNLNVMIQLSALDDGMNAVYLARQDCNSGLRLGLSAEIGRRVPANCTASGKALLAALAPMDLERRLGGARELVALTQESTSTIPQLREELAAIRSRGIAVDSEGVLPNVSCSAVSIHTKHREDGLLAISITADTAWLTPARNKLVQTALYSLAELLKARL